MCFPNEINGRPLESLVDWLARAFLITLVSLPADSVAGRHDWRKLLPAAYLQTW
jgi:hypothetical protein